MSLRFVILHHTGVESPHFDLMFEMEEGALLSTFRCRNWPPRVGDVLEELPEHRRAYLDYEGPVSDNRGHVKRITSGLVKHQILASDPVTLGLSLTTSDGLQLDLCLAHELDPSIESVTRWIVQNLSINR